MASALLKNIERSGKQVLIKLIRVLFPKLKQVDAAEIDRSGIKKVLVIRMEQKLGNLVMTTFFPRAIKDLFPNAEIDLLVHVSLKDIWDHNPFVNKLHLFSHNVHLKSPLKMLRLLKDIRRDRYDMVFDCSTPAGFSLSNSLLVHVTKADYRAGFKKGDSSRFLNLTVPPDHTNHYIEMNHDLLRLFDPGLRKYRPELYIDENYQQKAAEYLKNAGVDDSGQLVLLWVGARYNKQWKLNNFVETALAMGLLYGNAIFLCGPEEKEHFRDLSEKFKKQTIFVTDFRLLAALIEKCRLFVSGDAGPLHLAYALRKKTVGIYMEDNYTVYGYDNGSKNRIVDLSDEPDNYKKVIDICRGVFDHRE
ncbi:glycosyltransferase family 9 protein [candidate division KSB1 bacterium]